MMKNLFQGIFDSTATVVISVDQFLLCIGVSVLCGIVLAVCYAHRTRFSTSLLATLVLLPAVVCVVIMLVNGNVGAGVAVAGAFSLVRFRSAPGTAKEITVLFLAMGAGLINGMGYLAYGVLFSLLLGLLMLLLSYIRLGRGNRYKTLHITVPEDLNYSQAFDEILAKYADGYELTRVKTTNMGSLFRLTYDLTMKRDASEKELIDMLRCRNGNLEITVCRQEAAIPEL